MREKQEDVIAQLLAAEETDAQDREEVLAAELKQHRTVQADERAAHAAKLEAMRGQFEALQTEKLDSLLEEDETNARAKGMVSDLAKEGVMSQLRLRWCKLRRMRS